MWQTKYASTIYKNLGLILNFRLCSEGNFQFLVDQLHNPISTRKVVYDHHITVAPPDFQTLQRP